MLEAAMTDEDFPVRPANVDDIPQLCVLRRRFFDSQIASGLLDVPADLETALSKTTPSKKTYQTSIMEQHFRMTPG